MSGEIRIDSSSLKRFLKALDGHDLGKEVPRWLEANGFQFLEEVQREIIRLGVVDTRRLLGSFTKGGGENIWQISNGGLTLLVGTNVKYAQYVNDGHKQHKRWVPGYWQGDKFTYSPGSNTGMLLHEKRVEGKPYWDNGVIIFERMFEESFRRKLEEWTNRLGGVY
jgi:hypothetical protein